MKIKTLNSGLTLMQAEIKLARLDDIERGTNRPDNAIYCTVPDEEGNDAISFDDDKTVFEKICITFHEVSEHTRSGIQRELSWSMTIQQRSNQVRFNPGPVFDVDFKAQFYTKVDKDVPLHLVYLGRVTRLCDQVDGHIYDVIRNVERLGSGPPILGNAHNNAILKMAYYSGIDC